MVIRCFSPHLDVITLKLLGLVCLQILIEQKIQMSVLSVHISSVMVKQAYFVTFETVT